MTVNELKNIIYLGKDIKRTAFLNQRENREEWVRSREDLLTSSKFPQVLSKKNQTDCSALVEDIRYPRDLSKNTAIQWGEKHEKEAVAEFKRENSNILVIDYLGMFQNHSHPWLASTPDALLCDKNRSANENWGTLEIKCPYSCIDKTPKSASCFDKNQKLKKNHQYYRQIQGQMGCIGVNWGILVIWTPNGIHQEEIKFDANEWSKNVEKLNLFWRNALAPEIVDSRFMKRGDIRSWCINDGEVWRDEDKNDDET